MIATLLLLAAAATEAATMPAFMTGCWEVRSRPEEGQTWTQECWMEPKGGLMLGASREGDGDEIRSWEHMRIERATNGAITLYASPQGIPAVAFAARAASPTAIEFTNPMHDYPQRSRYELKEGRLEAEISLLDGTKAVQWSYRKEGD